MLRSNCPVWSVRHARRSFTVLVSGSGLRPATKVNAHCVSHSFCDVVRIIWYNRLWKGLKIATCSISKSQKRSLLVIWDWQIEMTRHPRSNRKHMLRSSTRRDHLCQSLSSHMSKHSCLVLIRLQVLLQIMGRRQWASCLQPFGGALPESNPSFKRQSNTSNQNLCS